MSELLHNTGAEALRFTYKAIDTIDTSITAIGLGPTVSLKRKKFTKREAYVVKAIQAQQWPQVKNLLHKLNSSEICLLVENITKQLKQTSNIEKWVEVTPNDYWAQLFHGHRLMHMAWEERGSGDSSTVSSRMAEGFWDHLFLSKNVLKKASELAPERVEPYSAMIIVEMGLGYNHAELWQSFIQVCKREKKHYVAHCNILHALCEKWGGSNKEMFDIAKSGSAEEPDGSLMYGLVPMAHIERWLYHFMCGEDSEANQYFHRDNVIDEIIDAYTTFDSNSNYQRSVVYFDVLNKFAFCFYLGSVADLTEELLKKIGYNANYYPWLYQSEPFLTSFDEGHGYSQAISDYNIKRSELSNKI